MKKTLGILLILLVLIACGDQQMGITDYETNKVKFEKLIFNSNNGEFSMTLPKNWFYNEETIDSNKALYLLEAGSKDSNLMAINVVKMNTISGNIDNEFDQLINQMTKRANNIKVIEKSQMKIGNKTSKIALLKYENNGKISQEEIDFFIPINDKQFYYLSLVSNYNENIENNFGMMIECAKTFKLIKKL